MGVIRHINNDVDEMPFLLCRHSLRNSLLPLLPEALCSKQVSNSAGCQQATISISSAPLPCSQTHMGFSREGKRQAEADCAFPGKAEI
jgi:hypothetical protein